MGTGRHSLAMSAAACALLAVGCSGGVSTNQVAGVFGLSSACAPTLAGDDVLVSPGELTIDEPGLVSGVRFLFGDPPPDHIVVSQWHGESLRAGDLTSISFEEAQTEPLVMTPLDELVVYAPGTWVLALRIPRNEPLQMTFIGLEYELDGRTYRLDGRLADRLDAG